MTVLLLDKDEVSLWISKVLSAVRVQLTTFVSNGDVDLAEVAVASDLNIARSIDEARSKDGTWWDQAGATTGFQAIGH